MHRFASWQLFAICVLVWGTTWYAITFQVAGLSPEFGVALRFAIAGLTVLLACVLRGERLQVPAAGHARLALQGSFMFGVSYLCVYHAERHIVSGLVAVGYSASPLVTGLGAHWLFGQRVTARFLLGGVIGLAGIVLIFWPEFTVAAHDAGTTTGAAFIAAAVALSSVGSLAASRNRLHGLAFWPALGLSMLYGAVTCGLVAVLLGREFVLPATPAWWISLVYLALAGSVLTFASFLTLQERIGPGPTSAIGVMTPLVALAVSMVFEGYRPAWLTFGGVLLAVAGNVLMLRRRVRQRQGCT